MKSQNVDNGYYRYNRYLQFILEHQKVIQFYRWQRNFNEQNIDYDVQVPTKKYYVVQRISQECFT